jgi:hypothetical protein
VDRARRTLGWAGAAAFALAIAGVVIRFGAEAPLEVLGLDVDDVESGTETVPPPEPAPLLGPPPPPETDPSLDTDPSIERLLAVPKGLAKPDPGKLSGADPATGVAPGSAKGVKPEWVDLGVEGKTEREKGTRQEATEVKGGVTVSPGKQGESQGDVSLTVEGAVREESSGRANDPVERSNSVGVRIEVPLPGQQQKKQTPPPE